MTTVLQELSAEAAAQALPGEWIEVFARRTRISMTRLRGSQAVVHDQVTDSWLVGIRSVLGREYGSASTDLPRAASVREALAVAREIRRFAPRPWLRRQPPAAASAGTVTQDGVPDDEPCLPGLSSLRSVAREARDASGVRLPVTITVGSTRRDVMRCDSTGWSAAYSQSEAQLHIRCAAPGLDAAQGARIRASVRELPVEHAAAEYARCLRNLSAGPIQPQAVDWVALSPLVVARILSRLSRGFLRGRWGLTSAAPEHGRQLGSSAVTLIDDGTVDGGPAGAPFDDEGMPRRRNVLLRGGKVETLLGSLESGPATGNACWAGWDSEITVATTNCFLEPTGIQASTGAPDLPGTGFIAEEVRGFRSGIDLTSSHIEFELAGAITRAGKQSGFTRLAVSARPDQFLKAFLEVLPGIEFYRITGIHGGSWCLADGSLVAK